MSSWLFTSPWSYTFAKKCFYTILQIAGVSILFLLGIGLAKWTYRSIMAALSAAIWIFSLGSLGSLPALNLTWPPIPFTKKNNIKKKTNKPATRVFDPTLYSDWSVEQHEKARDYHTAAIADRKKRR
jgi:hypothetical protein